MENKITRRDFLKQSLFASTALALGPWNILAADQVRIEKKARSKKVIIIGAGLAGLSAAYELSRAGHEVIVLEARSRPGGRVYTLRQPFAEGLYAEAGATRIPESHEWTIKYVELFGLELDEFRPTDLSDVHYLHGQRIIARHGEEIQWPVELTPEEKELELSGMRQKYITSVVKEIGDVSSADWPSLSLKKYDDMTWIEFLQKQGASPGAIELLTRGHSSGLYNQVSALQMLRVTAQGRRRGQMYKIRGGNERLPQAFAARLGEKIHYNSPVIAITQKENGVQATFLDSGQQQLIEGDYLVCTLPFSVLRKIEISPKFSPDKRRAIEQIWYTSIARVGLQTRRRFWLDQNLSGFATTDLPILETWDLSHNLPGTHGLLSAYSSGQAAQRISEMKENERITFSLQHMEKVFPEIREEFEIGASVCWDNEEWSRGGWAWLKPGQAAMIPHIASAEGRVYFAGDHTSAWSSWMQGALESGNRVAREVNEAA